MKKLFTYIKNIFKINVCNNCGFTNYNVYIVKSESLCENCIKNEQDNKKRTI